MKVNITNQAVDETANSYMSGSGIDVGIIGGQGPLSPQKVEMKRTIVEPKPTLEDSIAQNKRAVVGASSIRTLIKSAATRY